GPHPMVNSRRNTYFAVARAKPVARAISMNDNHPLVDALSKSQLFHDYQKAFCETTGLPLTLRPVESWQLPLHGKTNENRFCALMAGKSRSCANCLDVQQKLSDNGALMPYTT